MNKKQTAREIIIGLDEIATEAGQLVWGLPCGNKVWYAKMEAFILSKLDHIVDANEKIEPTTMIKGKILKHKTLPDTYGNPLIGPSGTEIFQSAQPRIFPETCYMKSLLVIYKAFPAGKQLKDYKLISVGVVEVGEVGEKKHTNRLSRSCARPYRPKRSVIKRL